MKSFPSTLNESQNMYGGGASQKYAASFDITRLTSMNLNTSAPVIQELLKIQNINISNSNVYPSMHEIDTPNKTIDSINNELESNEYDTVVETINEDGSVEKKTVKEQGLKLKTGQRKEDIFYENPLQLPADIIALAKDYEWVYKNRAKAIVSSTKSGESLDVVVSDTAVAPSMFNPMYGVSVKGITRNTPLLNDIKDDELDPMITDCSIRTLCALSKRPNSSLGQARYKYSDFMYCRDLGKVSNNHLITLRKFAHPIGDHIFEMTAPKYVKSSGNHSYQTEGDIGRMITWFGNGDNRLEDICKYSYYASWKELNSQIEEQDGVSDDPTTGVIGMLSNSFNPVYNTAVDAGQGGEHSIWGWLGSHVSKKAFQGAGKNNGLLKNYDNNKVYTPKNTIQSTYAYEGKLMFSHEFTLVFSYKLRAYDNINPRSAMMDLIGNVLEVTYRRGKFWGGDRKVIGPTQDLSAFDKTSKFIDNAFDSIGGYMQNLINDTHSFKDVLGKVGQDNKEGSNNSNSMLTLNNIKSLGNEMMQHIAKTETVSEITEAAKGMFKNALGRPTFFAWQSFLSGDDVGLWHVTIGNPRNPILSIGNLILTNATVQHSGPLGVDDFPTDLKVSITLKHARPRDVTDIGRMYTRGASAIYHHFGHHNLKDFFGQNMPNVQCVPPPEQKYDEYGQPMQQENANAQAKYQNAQDAKNKLVSEYYNEDVNKYGGNSKESTFKKPDLVSDDNKIPNPLLMNDSEAIRISRTNNWSDTMFVVSIQEAA